MGGCFKSNKCPQSSLGQTFEPRALCSLLKRGLLLKGCGCIVSRGAGASREASRAGLVIQVDQGKNPGGGVNVLPACGDASPSAGRCRYDRVSHSEMVGQSGINCQINLLYRLSSTLLYLPYENMNCGFSVEKKTHPHEKAHSFYSNQAGTQRKEDLKCTNFVSQKECAQKLLATEKYTTVCGVMSLIVFHGDGSLRMRRPSSS